MNLSKSAIFLTVVFIVTGCATNTNTMTTTSFKNGRSETVYWSKYYSSASWVIEGEVGVEVWLDHDKKVSPLYSFQDWMGILGPGDLKANGIVTGYLINLSEAPRQVFRFRVIPDRADQPVNLEQAIQLDPHTVTQVHPGTFPIANYGTEVGLTVELDLDGIEYHIPLKAQRLTREDMVDLRGDFPWFQEPYFPFDPPLANSNF
ncbi:hypothetical protein ABMA57_02460 [Saccharospirillum sp. HFRX-1]|uniref:hypothetical protein n=1 Tax=unclassified Saccharospirillum TaxID=2633430 RepID=UPI0037187020